ncbi:MAG: DUF4129 domain-containing protein [bacterium]|nr:DUF4129 domain-containing protein [bacterium]
MRWTRSGSSENPRAPGVEEHRGAPRRPDGFWEGVGRLLPVARAVMEFCWLYPWIIVVGGGFYGATGPILSAGWAFLLLVGAQVAARQIADRDGLPWPAGGGDSLPHERILLVGAGAVLGFAAIHEQYYAHLPVWHPAWVAALLQAAHDVLPEVPKPASAALAAACLWWRGLVLGARHVGAIEIEEAYKTGVGMVVVYLLAAAVYADTRGFAAAGPEMPPTMLAFFFLGLSALALARLAAIWERSRPDERSQIPARAWVLLITGVVGLIMLAAGMMAGMATADVFKYLGVVLRPLIPVVEALFVVLFVVAGLVVRVLIAILSRLPRREVPDIGPAPTVFDDLLRRLRELEMHPHVVSGARWGMVLAVIAILVAGMTLAVVLRRRRERRPDEDDHESVWSVREMLRGLAGRLPRLGRRQEDDDGPSAPAVGAIRRIYRELLGLGAGLGAPRYAWATPREHEPRLREVLPGSVAEVELLTAAYERVRYGTWRPAAVEVREAEEALERAKASPASGSGV